MHGDCPSTLYGLLMLKPKAEAISVPDPHSPWRKERWHEKLITISFDSFMINKFYDLNFLGNSWGCTRQDIQHKHFVSTTLHLLLYKSPQMRIFRFIWILWKCLFTSSQKNIHTILQIYSYIHIFSTNC